MDRKFGYRYWNVRTDPILDYVLVSPEMGTIWHPDGVGFDTPLSDVSLFPGPDESIGFSAYVSLEGLVTDYYASEWPVILGMVELDGTIDYLGGVMHCERMIPVSFFREAHDTIKVVPTFEDETWADITLVRNYTEVLSKLASIYGVDIFDVSILS